MATADATPTGMELRLLRTARRLTVSAVAREAGWSHQRASAIEASARPTPRTAGRYIAAILAAEAERDAR